MIKGSIRGSTHLVSYYCVPLGDFGLKHIYLISDPKNGLFNDLMT